VTQLVETSMLDATVLKALRGKNRIINGDMAIDQRQGGASITVTSGPVFPVDRFRAGMSGANGTGQRIFNSTPGFPYLLRLTGASGTTSAYVGQYIEAANSASLVGQQVTVSFCMAASAITSVNVALKYANSADDFSATTVIETVAKTITSTLTLYTVTFAASMPANAANGVYLEFNTGANLGATTWSITGVQLEVGTVATPFEFRHYGHELALCQRYYYKATARPLGLTRDTTEGYSSLVHFPVPMRTTPTLDAGASYSVGSGSAGTPSISGGNSEAVRMSNSATNWTVNVTISLTAGFTAELA